MLVELLLIYNIILSFHQPSEGDWIGTQSKPERTLRGQKEIPPFVDEMMCVLLKLSSLGKVSGYFKQYSTLLFDCQ